MGDGQVVGDVRSHDELRVDDVKQGSLPGSTGGYIYTSWRSHNYIIDRVESKQPSPGIYHTILDVTYCHCDASWIHPCESQCNNHADDVSR